MTEYHGYLDRFTIVGQCLIAEGWANEQDFKLWYDDVSIPFVSTHVPRPDLAWAMDGRAQSWGFSLCAAIPFPDIQAARFQLRLNAGMTLVDPANCFARHEDHQFADMTARFRDEVAQKRGALLEIGSRARSGNLYRGWFPPDIRYVGLDVTDGPNVDIVGDAHHLSRHINEKVDFIFSIAVFEHILMPWKVAIEMNKVMKPDGLALIISHNAWPLHEEPWDFLRFSKESWAGFFNQHTGLQFWTPNIRTWLPLYLNMFQHSTWSV